MKRKKRIAWLLAGVMLLSSVNTFGTIQKPIDKNKLQTTIVSHKGGTDSTPDISPNVEIQFLEADNNDTSTEAASGHTDTHNTT